MKKNVRMYDAQDAEGEIIMTGADLRKLRAKLNLAACDLHVASPFLPAKRDPDYMLVWRV